MKRLFTIFLIAAFLFIISDKMSAETSNWAKDSNKHYNISKTNSIHFFKIKQVLNPTFSLFEDKKQLENLFRNVLIPSKHTTKLYILYCELKFEVTTLPSNSLGVNWLLILQYILAWFTQSSFFQLLEGFYELF